MLKRLALIALVLAAAGLSGCSKCDFWWGGSAQPGACKTDNKVQ